MIKLLLAAMALAAGGLLVHAQGLVSVSSTVKGTVQTNGVSVSEVTGNAGGVNAFDYEVLDMTVAAYGGLSSQQQAGLNNLLANPSELALWTDSGVSGASGSINNGGEVTALAGGVTAANWAAPGSTYQTSDYYMIVGWSSNEGTTWGSLSNSIAGGNFAVTGAGSWFGETAVAFNSAGGGTTPQQVVNLWLPSTATGITGSGLNGANPQLILTPIITPEPTTLALAGLGGLSMLFLRRRKA